MLDAVLEHWNTEISDLKKCSLVKIQFWSSVFGNLKTFTHGCIPFQKYHILVYAIFIFCFT